MSVSPHRRFGGARPTLWRAHGFVRGVTGAQSEPSDVNACVYVDRHRTCRWVAEFAGGASAITVAYGRWIEVGSSSFFVTEGTANLTPTSPTLLQLADGDPVCAYITAIDAGNVSLYYKGTDEDSELTAPVAGSSAAWTTYVLTDAVATADPNNLQDGALAASGDGHTFTWQNTGTIYDLPNEGAAFVFDLVDAEGGSVSGLDHQDLVRLAVEYADALPQGGCVSVVVYDGGGAAPSATDEGFGVLVMDDAGAGMSSAPLRSQGAGWLVGTPSVPDQTDARRGLAGILPVNGGNQQNVHTWIETAAGAISEGSAQQIGAVDMSGIDTLAVVVGTCTADNLDAETVTLRGQSYVDADTVGHPPQGSF